jgi:hypothetical protein
MEDAKRDFEKGREKQLSQLPDNIKSMFGQIGFAFQEYDEEREIVPVLVLSPYDVPPKPFRDIYWFDLFSQVKRSNKLPELAYLVYHYGSADLGDCYSFVEQADFEPYESGKEKGYGSIPFELQQKINAGIELTEEEMGKIRAIQEMEEDIAKDPAERKRGCLGFKERYEEVIDGDDRKLPPMKKAPPAKKKQPSAKRQKKN